MSQPLSYEQRITMLKLQIQDEEFKLSMDWGRDYTKLNMLRTELRIAEEACQKST